MVVDGIELVEMDDFFEEECQCKYCFFERKSIDCSSVDCTGIYYKEKL